MAAARRRKKPPARQPVFTARGMVVAGLAVLVFAAALILNTDALLILPFACAAGACGRTAQWAVLIVGGLVLAAAVVAVIRRRRRRGGGARRRAPAGRRSPRKPARKPAAGQPAGPT